jgi:hypothetical protein
MAGETVRIAFQVTCKWLNPCSEATPSHRLYSVRVTLLDDEPISSSLPSSCLAEYFDEEQWTLTIDEAGHLVSLQLSVPDGICNPQKALEVVGRMHEGHHSESRPIVLKVPQEAPSVVHTPQGDQQGGE